MNSLMYADKEYYLRDNDTIPEKSIEKALKRASRHIDSLTFNRIRGRGFENLTEFQQNIIKDVCCEMANFEHENEDVIQSVLSQYSINGVTMHFGESWNIAIESGIAIRKDTYELLKQTGLCCRSFI